MGQPVRVFLENLLPEIVRIPAEASKVDNDDDTVSVDRRGHDNRGLPAQTVDKLRERRPIEAEVHLIQPAAIVKARESEIPLKLAVGLGDLVQVIANSRQGGTLGTELSPGRGGEGGTGVEPAAEQGLLVLGNDGLWVSTPGGSGHRPTCQTADRSACPGTT